MSDESLAYEIICEEEENHLPPTVQIKALSWIEDHDTGKKRIVMINEGSLHDWFSKSKSKGGKPGWVQSDGSPCAMRRVRPRHLSVFISEKTSEGRKKIRSADARKSRRT